jgi:hypothetical protein
MQESVSHLGCVRVAVYIAVIRTASQKWTRTLVTSAYTLQNISIY